MTLQSDELTAPPHLHVYTSSEEQKRNTWRTFTPRRAANRGRLAIGPMPSMKPCASNSALDHPMQKLKLTTWRLQHGAPLLVHTSADSDDRRT